jgi:hypothetical protein
MRPWQPDPDDPSRWLGPTFRVLAAALVVLVGVTLAILEYFVAVLWLKGRYERDLARRGIVQGGDALSQAVVPALWLTLVLVAVQVAVIALVVLAVRHRRAATDPA